MDCAKNEIDYNETPFSPDYHTATGHSVQGHFERPWAVTGVVGSAVEFSRALLGFPITVLRLYTFLM